MALPRLLKPLDGPLDRDRASFPVDVRPFQRADLAQPKSRIQGQESRRHAIRLQRFLHMPLLLPAQYALLLPGWLTDSYLFTRILAQESGIHGAAQPSRQQPPHKDIAELRLSVRLLSNYVPPFIPSVLALVNVFARRTIRFPSSS